MRLREGRDWGLLFMPMVKLVQEVVALLVLRYSMQVTVVTVGSDVNGGQMFGVQGPGGLD